MTLRPPTLFMRLLILTLPVEALILMLFAIYLVRGTERREEDAFDGRLRLQCQALLGTGALDPKGRLWVDRELAAHAIPHGTFACILDEGGGTLWETPGGWLANSGLRAASREGLEYVNSALVAGGRVRVMDSARRIKRPGDGEVATGPLVEAVVAQPLSGLEGSNRAFREKAAAIGVALLGLTAALLWAAIRAGLSPVGAMMRRLQDVPGPSGKGRLDEALVLGELRPLAREINGLLDRLWGMVQLEKRFTAEAAHQLRTPLTLVKSTLQTALLTAGSRDDHEGALREALEDLQGLERTAESLLTLARAEAPSPEKAAALEEISLPGLLQGMADRFGPAAGLRGLTMALNVRPAVILGRREAVEHLLVNLIDNAIKYSAPGGSITLFCARDGGSVLAAVEDGGPPIPERDRPHLFQQFFRGASGRAAQIPGAGLGLSIAAAMARLNGAALLYEPDGRGGNRFVVRFQPPEDS